MAETAPPSLPLRRHLIANAIALAPSGLALLILVWMDALPLLHALIAFAGIAVATAIVVRRYVLSVGRFARFVEALSRGDDADVPRFVLSPAAEELAGGVAALTRLWRRQRTSIDSLSASAQAIVDGLPDPLLGIDGNRRVVRFNRAARSLLGPIETGRDLAATLRQPSLLDSVDAALAGRPIEEPAEITVTGPPARILAAHITALPRPTDDGSLVLVVLHDMTALRRAERMRADFVANASHELRTPLASLVGFVETLRGPARDDAEARERFLAIMAEQTGRMRRLVEDLLSLSRIEQREHEPPVGRVEVGPLLRGLVEMLEMKARPRDVSLRLNLADGLPAVIGDRDELAMAFQNLIDNAVKYTRPGTTVTVDATRQDGSLRLVVRDHGEGIAAEHLPRLTERFYRVDTARSRQMGGTGLGLAIVKHVLNRHRGRLEVESAVGEGSTFTVLLPASEFSTAPAELVRP
ncbi:phosphate regulon sensor histidine kinase PhoR [Reyranella sp. CPCC 100927]|uniref:phosphate regulon sensor histidine kinase PhoR n=1 Tax=Reyranella sp. CPCC 100927 TaxID=2599616 RepID=UPI0011B80273|nr:phosphate regulon sensor histidine kinase PhoR [Reyranella sp. CPCC 100927]TWS95703.1 phosphate regulon sensor histidine kinase PhoR [Reyranella sp. CPCC 100927]